MADPINVIQLLYNRDGQPREVVLHEVDEEPVSDKNVVYFGGRLYLLAGDMEETQYLVKNIKAFASRENIDINSLKTSLEELGAQEVRIKSPQRKGAKKAKKAALHKTEAPLGPPAKVQSEIAKINAELKKANQDLDRLVHEEQEEAPDKLREVEIKLLSEKIVDLEERKNQLKSSAA